MRSLGNGFESTTGKLMHFNKFQDVPPKYELVNLNVRYFFILYNSWNEYQSENFQCVLSFFHFYECLKGVSETSCVSQEIFWLSHCLSSGKKNEDVCSRLFIVIIFYIKCGFFCNVNSIPNLWNFNFFFTWTGQQLGTSWSLRKRPACSDQ